MFLRLFLFFFFPPLFFSSFPPLLLLGAAPVKLVANQPFRVYLAHGGSHWLQMKQARKVGMRWDTARIYEKRASCQRTDSQDKIHVIRTLQCVRSLNPWLPSWLCTAKLSSQNVLYFVLPGYSTAGWTVLKLGSFAISPQSFSPSLSPALPAPALFISLPWKR